MKITVVHHHRSTIHVIIFFLLLFVYDITIVASEEKRKFNDFIKVYPNAINNTIIINSLTRKVGNFRYQHRYRHLQQQNDKPIMATNYSVTTNSHDNRHYGQVNVKLSTIFSTASTRDHVYDRHVVGRRQRRGGGIVGRLKNRKLRDSHSTTSSSNKERSIDNDGHDDYDSDSNSNIIIDEYDNENDDNENDDNNVVVSVRATLITSSTKEHVDQKMTDGSYVNEEVTFIFLNNNNDAYFSIRGDDTRSGNNNKVRRRVPVVSGTKVTFMGNMLHQTIVNNGDVRLLGPFTSKDLIGVTTINGGSYCDIYGSICLIENPNNNNNYNNNDDAPPSSSSSSSTCIESCCIETDVYNNDNNGVTPQPLPPPGRDGLPMECDQDGDCCSNYGTCTKICNEGTIDPYLCCEYDFYYYNNNNNNYINRTTTSPQPSPEPSPQPSPEPSSLLSLLRPSSQPTTAVISNSDHPTTTTAPSTTSTSNPPSIVPSKFEKKGKGKKKKMM